MSDLEQELMKQMRLQSHLPEPEREYRFHPQRRWRLDFAWPEPKIAMEVEGATWQQGRHTRGSGFAADCEKYNEAALHGWTILRVTAEHVRDGSALHWLLRALRPATEESPW